MQRKSTVRRSAFTLTELAIAGVVVAILTVSAWPDREADDQSKLDTAVTRFEADVGYARSLALTSPTDPPVLKVDLEYDYYWIAKKSAPDTPVTNPSTRKPYVVRLGRGGESTLQSVGLTADSLGANHTLEFTSSGGVVTDGSVGVEFAVGTKRNTLKISPGSVAMKQMAGDLASVGVSNAVAENPSDGGELRGGSLGGLGF